MQNLFVSIFVLVFLVGKSRLSFEFQGTREKYCSKVVSYSEDVVVPETQKKKETYKEFCMSFTFTCTKHRYVIVKINKTVTIQKTKRVFDCCRGYEKKNNICIPICRLGCGHGECIEPDICLCDPGWREPFCLSECEAKRFGRGCKSNCTCYHGAQCDKKTGVCHCTPGYTGEKCMLSCPEDTYGQDCKSVCECMNGAICDMVDGTCYCQPGYEGENCEKPCDSGTHGRDCEKQCICIPENTESCHHVDGKCKCKPGYKGENCEEECDDFTYGRNCSKKCKCINSEFCDHIDGECYCKPGWTDETCSSKCPIGKFGENCSFVCEQCLKISGNCDHVTGDCNCPPGFYGDICENPCPDGYWGLNCSKNCGCDKNELCNSRDGKCVASIIECPAGYWGPNCSKNCECYKNDFCDPKNGECSSSTAEKYKYRGTTISILVCSFMLIAIVIATLCIWGYIQRDTLKSRINVPFLNLYVRRKRSHSGNESLPGSTMNNPLYEIPPEVILESEQNGGGFIRGSYSSGVMYVKNNVNNLDVENKQSNVKCAINLTEETNKKQSDQKDSEIRKSAKKEVLSDLKDAFKEMKRNSMRSSLHKATSTTSSTAELEDDFQPETLDDFNTIENIYENPNQNVIEGIYDKPLHVDDKNISMKEP